MPFYAQGFTSPRGTRGRKLRFYAALAAITLISVLLAYWRSFGTLASYDDEGTMMLTAQRFFDGQVLYQGARSPYGPVFYAYQWVVHALGGFPISHDSVRFISIAFWVASSLILFALVYRLTESLPVALVAHYFGFRALGFIGAETAHPQEACILFLLLLGLAATCTSRNLAMILMGGLAGAITLTKINLGIFAAAALVLTLAWALPPSRARRILFPAAAAGALLLPLALISGHASEGWAVRYALLVMLSLVAALVTIARTTAVPPLAPPHFGVLCLGFAAAVAVIAAFPIAMGSTLGGMFHNLVVFPFIFYTGGWSVPLHVTPWAIVWSLAGGITAWLAASGRLPAGAIAAMKFGFAAAIAGLLLVYNFDDLVSFSAPFLWLAAIPSRQPAPQHASLARPLLVVIGVLQVLYAYPVAGSQSQFATVIPAVIAALCAWDALPWLAQLVPATARFIPGPAMLCLAILYAITSLRANHGFETLEPLGLRGAQRLRAEPQMARSLRELAIAAQSCSMLISEPGIFSLNFFSGTPAPSTMTLGEWVLHPNGAEQERIIREMESQPRACAVVYPAALRVWTQGRDISEQPLVRYIAENFTTVMRTSGYSFQVRKTSLSP